IDSSVFTNNITNYLFGGGIAIEDNSDSITISNSHFTGNQTLTAVGNVGGGGAIYSNSGTVINITKCVFDSNRAFYGGALYFGNSSKSLVGNSFFLNNSASASGGAVDCRGLGATFYNTVSSGNKASNNGGAFYSESPCSVYFSTFVRNSAGVGGGAVDGSISLLNSLTWLNSVAGDSLTSPVDPMFANINNIAGPDGIYGTGDDGLRLTLQSPFVNDADAPYDTSLIITDITGAPRVRLQSIEPDMGAYELDFCAASDFVNKTIYVDSSAVAGNNTGRDWANAFTDLETAFKAFRSGCNLDTIKVAKGTYFPTAVPGSLPNQAGSGFDNTFYLEENLVLLGGYPTGGGKRDFRQNPTNLSGDSYMQHVVLIINKTNVSIDGFNIVDGNPTYATSDAVDNEAINRFGGGLYASNSKLNIKNITFSNNNESGSYLINCSGTLTYCIWDSNQSDFGGGGVFNSGSSVEYDNCIFYKNIGTNAWGGGLFINNTNTAVPSFEGCTFYGNSSTWGGGISSGATPTITNCLFWGNSSTNSRPDASTNDVYAGILDSKQISFSLFQYTPTASLPGNNCIYGVDPGLADGDNGAGPDNIWGTIDDGLRQTGSSFTINNGINDSIPADVLTDITGATRINTGVVDIGAYEYDCGFTNLTNLLVPVGTSQIATNTFSTCGTWQYRTSTTDPSKYIIEVDPNGNDNFNPVQIKVDVTKTQSQIATDVTGDTTAVALRMASINAPGTYLVNGGLKVRIYYDPLELDTLPGIIHYWYKHTAHDKSTVLSDLSADTLLNEVPIKPSSYGIINGIHYVEFDSLSSFSTFGYLGATHANRTLPLNYLSFTAKWQQANNSVLLNWSTANEVNVQSFIVERSQDALSWQSIGKLNSDLSLSLQHQYKWTDPQPLTGNSYYRIKELDKDGMSTFSNTQMVRIGKQTAIFQILPNPVRNDAIIRLPGNTPVVSYKVTDVSGRVICNGLLYNMSEFPVSLASQSDGIYFVTVNGVTQKLVLSK
ncbi:MAG: T9SS type A sorting domain-containing protein, partial [Ginsengibacter sp.]